MQAMKTYTITAENGQASLLVAAADGENDAVFSKVVRLHEGEVGHMWKSKVKFRKLV